MDCVKRDQDGNGCYSCFETGSDDCYFDSNEGKCIGREPFMNPYYLNADQLTALIKEAESGAHKWVRENTEFICDKHADCGKTTSTHCSPHVFAESCRRNCKYMGGKLGSCIPYQGSKSEEKTWPGKDGETHQEALRELGLTDEDCSEVEAAPNWNEDGRGCGTCVHGDEPAIICVHKDGCNCGFAVGYCMYERKGVADISTYNEDKAAIKVAREDVLKEESGEWEKKGYEKPLCMYCPITEHCAIKFINTKYHNCMGD